jgi:hypothetical protein
MDELVQWVKQYPAITAAVISGTCAIVAAFIRRGQVPGKKRAKKSYFGRLMLSFVCLLLGAGLLGVEYFHTPVDPEKGLTFYHFDENKKMILDDPTDNPGALLILGGFLLLSTGAIWSMINFIKWATAPAPPPESLTEIRRATVRNV